VVDDASTDSTPSLLESNYAVKGFRIFRNSERKGASFCRNIGIKQAIGDWIMFLDADDELPPDSVSVFENEALSFGADMFVSAYIRQRHNGKASQSRHGLQNSGSYLVSELAAYIENYMLEPYKYTLLVHCWGKIFRRALAVENDVYFDESLDQLEDVNFNFNFLRYSSIIRFTAHPCYHHYIHQPYSMSVISGSEERAVEKMSYAYAPIKLFLLERCKMEFEKVDTLAKQLIFTTSVIWLMRTKRRFTGSSITHLASNIDSVVKSPLLRACIPFYKLMPNDSRLLYLSLKTGSPFICSLALFAKTFFQRR
jgi:glycosyltransferase involved in cell wall biosynthesis